METKFLSEDLFADSEIIVEASDDGKDLYLSGIMMQAGIKNRNGRVYSNTDLTRSVNLINERMNNGESIMGELDHPPKLSINLDRVSHVITEMKMVGDDAIGKLKILDTPMGKIAKTLINAGIKIGVSSRGTGSVSRTGQVSNYLFTAMDVVAQPSAPSAYPESVMEALEIATNSNSIPLTEMSETVTNDPKLQKYLEKELLKFINGLKG